MTTQVLMPFGGRAEFCHNLEWHSRSNDSKG